ncbi:Aerobic cobaltochelatase subunit CobN [Methyloligella halotolerans]|uniref:Aerobic cobaltochelatase subunit CobN n=1 Tax=Methyloligella halotolerans TaxID=1177755 RepID=A0A1E2S1R0_9HYPH|nr:cobaltochelatase subunit CobN [Methyloligella halotolerans]ODA68265.1 Aerobic cobaltochelatase subunit CobN [Methyloligella halotolerans]
MHLLATETATLDEVETAVDLEQTPADIVVLSFSDSDLSALASAWSAAHDELPSLRLANLKRLRHPMSVDVYIETVIAGARLVVIRGIGGLDYWRYGFESIAKVARAKGIHFVALPGDDRPDPRLAELCTAPENAVARFDRYFREGGPENLGNALRLAANLLGQEIDAAEPVALGPSIAMHRDGAMADPALLTADPAKPTALILFYRANLMAADAAPIAQLMTALEGQGLNALALAVTSLKDPNAADTVEELIARTKPSVILNATAFSARREDDTTVLDGADAPVLQVAMAGSTHDAWTEAARGLSPSDLAMNVVLPELDGRLFTRTISFKEEREADEALQYSATMHAPVPDRIEYVAALASRWAKLRNTAAADRRLALMISDYPARGGRTGYACGLDTAASVTSIAEMLAEAGYDTAGADWPAEEIVPLLTAAEPQETLRVSLASYRQWMERNPEAAGRISDAWGAPEEDPRFGGGEFSFPCLRAGKLTIVLQPDRGSLTDRKQGYHDPDCPPRHGYAALYLALREAEKIDALIHLGTHGTLEWLPGNAIALSRACLPEAVLGPLPVIYPFIVNNPGEAVQAKRRISAVTIGHLTPPLSEAGLHGAMAEMEGLIEEYMEADGVDRRRMPLLEAEILDVAWRTGLAEDCGLSRDDVPREAIAKLDAQLCDIKDLAIRDSLHVFGQAPETEAAARLADATLASMGSSAESVTKDWLERLIAESAEAERHGLLAALDGRRVPPGPAGAPTRGRLDILPTGRNLTTIDPRAIPTRIATTIGARAADDVIRRHLQDQGEYPGALMLDLWASASLRTGGDDLAQALAYLGVRPQWDPRSNRVTGIEVLPLAKLDRPRIDVTLRISGLFRDIFPAQIALFDMAVRKVAERDEEDEWNPLAAARKNGESLSRIFGGAPGSYGAGMTDRALDSDWSTRADLAEAYLAAGSYAYGPGESRTAARHDFAARIAGTDALVHPQDDRERDLLDGDGIADFVGGFAAAAASLGDKSPALYHLDTSKPDTPVTRTVSEEIARVVRGRLTNPRWIACMLTHGHRGVAEMAQAVDALYAFAAGTESVPGHLFDEVHEALIADAETRTAIAHANPDALASMLDRLNDLLARGLWSPKRNAVHQELGEARRPTREGPPREAAE